LKSWGLSENILKDFGNVDNVTKKKISALATAKPTRAKEQLREHTPRKV